MDSVQGKRVQGGRIELGKGYTPLCVDVLGRGESLVRSLLKEFGNVLLAIYLFQFTMHTKRKDVILECSEASEGCERLEDKRRRTGKLSENDTFNPSTCRRGTALGELCVAVVIVP